MGALKKDSKTGDIQFTGGIGDIIKIAKDNKQMDGGTKKAVSSTKKAIKNDMNSTADALGIDKKDLKSTIKELENDQNLSAYNESMSILNKYKSGIEDGSIAKGSKEYQEYKSQN